MPESDITIYPGWGVPPECYAAFARACGASPSSVFDYGFFSPSPIRMQLPEPGMAKVLVGHSLGGLFALKQILENKIKPEKVVLFNAFARFVRGEDGGDASKEIEAMRRGLSVNPSGVLKAFFRRAARPGIFTPPSPEHLNERALAEGLELLAGLDMTPMLVRQVGLKVVCAFSKNDHIVPVAASERLAYGLGARAVDFDRAGHLALLQSPESAAAIVTGASLT